MLEKLQKISFITVAYNSFEDIKNLFSSISVNCVLLEFELIVVDNSGCSSTKLFCDKNNICYIDPKKNLGFSKANNVGAKSAKFEWLFFVNPDCTLDALAIDVFLSKSFLYVPYLREMTEGDSYSGVRNIVPTLDNITLAIVSKKNAIYWYRGSSILISTKLFEEINGWPEEYFLYCEDLDLYYIAHKKNIKISRVQIFVSHIGCRSSSTVFTTTERQQIITRSLIIFYKKYRLKYSIIFAYPLIALITWYRHPMKSSRNLMLYFKELIAGSKNA